MGKTFAEKILGKAAGRDAAAGDVVVVTPDFCMSHENSSAIIGTFRDIGLARVAYPEKLAIIFDHMVPASTEAYAQSQKVTRAFAREQGLPHFYDMHHAGGICHQVMCQEGFAAPGYVIVGSDSHTCTHGAMGAFATGVGRSEMAALWATGEIWLQVPESVKVVAAGTFAEGVSAKDLILTIIGDCKADGAEYMSVEFHGRGIADMAVSERMTLCNMGIEMGAKNAVCKPDGKVLEMIGAGAKGRAPEMVWADDDAVYAQVWEYDLASIVPSVARPHAVDNHAPVSEVLGTPISQAFLGTCTNARLDDLRLAASILKGRKVAVRTIVNPASAKVLRDAMDEGVIQVLLDAGCTVCPPGCGPCIGVSGGVLAPGEVCLSTANRNFKGRMGSKDSEIYLASPMTVAWSAVHGAIRDPREAL